MLPPRNCQLYSRTKRKGLEEYRIKEPLYPAVQENTFDRLWEMPLEPVDQPNYRGKGQSRVYLWKTESHWLIVKKQSDYLTRNPSCPICGIPAAEREFQNLLLFRQIGIATPTPVYFGRRRRRGHSQAILITEYASDFLSLQTLLSQWQQEIPNPSAKKKVIQAVALEIRRLHHLRLCHRHLVPKHILLNPACSPAKVMFIDLEAVRRFIPFRKNRQAELASLNNRSRLVSRTDKLRFLFAYLGISKWTPQAKKWAREILRKSDIKRRKSENRLKNFHFHSIPL